MTHCDSPWLCLFGHLHYTICFTLSLFIVSFYFTTFRAFLQSEISHIRNHSFDLNYDFTKLWTAKESIVKYLGLGFSLDPLKLYFNNEVQDEIYCDGKKLSKLFFKIYDLNGYVITVCSECETFSENIEWFVPE